MTAGSSTPDTHKLYVFIGQSTKVAKLSVANDSDSHFFWDYDPQWKANGFAISPYLPLQGECNSIAIRNFLQNLLPEGKGLEDIISNTTISKNNIFGLIKVIGEDTSGALSFRAVNQPSKSTSFRSISSEELTQRLFELKNQNNSIIHWDNQTRLSVAGVQDKLNLLTIDNEIGFGEGELCSNQIFKFEVGKTPFISINELFTMTLGRNAGMSIPKVTMQDYGEVRTLIVERFDRRYQPQSNKVQRRHIIDGCQAVNLPTSYKYERNFGDTGDSKIIRDGVSFEKLIQVKTNNHAAYVRILIEWLTFNLINRNYDAHGKNISFFVDKSGLSTAPFYDLVNIEALIQSGSKGIAQTYAMSIGDYEAGSEGHFSHPITAYMLADLATTFGVTFQRMQLIMQQMANRTLNAIEQSKQQALIYPLTPAEKDHLDLCIDIVKQSAQELLVQIALIPQMADYV